MYILYRDISWHDYSCAPRRYSHIIEGGKITLTLYKRDKRKTISDDRENSLMIILINFTLS